jgi:class 3 adenylate cyclase
VTIRRRLTLGFLIILALFAVNEGIQLWSARQRATTMEMLSGALKRQVAMSSVTRRVNDIQNQMALMQMIEGAQPVATIGADIARAGSEIAELSALSDAAERPAIDELQRTYQQLATAWQGFFETLGVDEVQNVAFKLQAEPLGRRVLRQQLPALQKQQDELVAKARTRFEEVTRFTDRISVGIFALSMFVSIAVAYVIGRYLTTSLYELSQGAGLIGAMNLEHRIAVRSHDEIGTVAEAFNGMASNLAHARAELTEANRVSQSLLLNILPEQVATELAVNGKFAPRYFEDVTVLFTDFVGFTLATEKLAAEELVDVLHSYFTAFDQIVGRYQLEKMKTIGDAYFCAGGLPVRSPSHPIDALLAAFELVREVEGRTLPSGATWAVRIGLHTGPVVAGVVGIKKFAFDVWGDTVNLGSRMESGGAPNRINVSESVYRRAKDFFTFEARGRVLTKEKKELEMFLVTGVQPALLAGDDPSAGIAPPAFVQRYRTYFGKDPIAFPQFVRSNTFSLSPNLSTSSIPTA